MEELKQRLLAIQALETARCFEEGVLTDVREADVGSILGFGYAPYSGGTLSYIDMMGTKKFVELCQRLEKKYGDALRAEQAAHRDGGEGRKLLFALRAEAAEGGGVGLLPALGEMRCTAAALSPGRARVRACDRRQDHRHAGRCGPACARELQDDARGGLLLAAGAAHC